MSVFKIVISLQNIDVDDVFMERKDKIVDSCSIINGGVSRIILDDGTFKMSNNRKVAEHQKSGGKTHLDLLKTIRCEVCFSQAPACKGTS